MELSGGAVRTACEYKIMKAQDDMEEIDANSCNEWKLTTVDPQESNTMRSCVRFAMCTATWKGPTDVDDALTPAH